MAKIYTKGGDKGKTGIFGGERVNKDDIRIEANGTLDELNAVLGVVRAYIQSGNFKDSYDPLIYTIQKELMSIMSLVASPSYKRDQNPNTFNKDLIELLEKEIDNIVFRTEKLGYFILPGGNLLSSHLQLARTIARRAERRLYSLNRIDIVPEEILIFINRLSDLLFVMAQFSMQQDGLSQEIWKEFKYKNKK